ncbi:Callose synthase 12 [Ananas comosus]|uniref:1,3-beta-glucan synthase n=1 Tax=Ananas comosus TaxID=4615 RepID=A0A199VI03_ANACO|nr:Callose synthase 12 [Ananas comosus]
MSLRQRPVPGAAGNGPRRGPGGGGGGAAEAEAEAEAYNIIPIHNVLADHPSLRFPEVRAAMAALRTVGDLRTPPFVPWHDGLDLLDWLGAFFGFQRDNVRNQREHLVLLLANAQMRLQPPPDNIEALDPAVVRRLRKKLLHNYTSWCAFLGRKPNVWVSDSPSPASLLRRPSSSSSADPRRDLLYISLYLLIWGEAANLRFVPECLAYIFHHMAMDLNRILEGYTDDATGRPALPAISGENAFLARVVVPVYKTISAEVAASRNGTAPHTAWRNYDDVNEYFWSRHVFDRLRWPLDLSRGFFAAPPSRNRVGKTGFVEQRSFWNVYRSFDRLWVMLLLFLQAAAIVAWQGHLWPWRNLRTRDDQVPVLTVFITWAALRLLQAMLDAGTQYSLVSRENRWLALRMALKILVAAGWTVAFSVLYARVWDQRHRDRGPGWSRAADQRLLNFLEAAAVFVLPEVLALVLFLVPWLRNFLEKTNWRILYVLTWWFQTRTFVGRGLREGLVDNVKYSLFWAVLLAAKFSFSYFLQIQPMVAPTKAIYNIRRVNYQWHEFFAHANRFAAVVLWIPVVLIYLMDIQIWYAIFSSLTGALVGLFSHLGEIRNVQQLRLRFQFFASAMQFNLMPEEQLFKDRGTLRSKFKDAILRLKLRYGLGRPYKKIESNQVEARRFALIWNEIIASFREEDVISDREVELLELPPDLWNIRVVRWPCLLLCNELLLALGQAKELEASDRRHWRKICKNEYRRCAVIEAYDSVRFLLLRIVGEGTEEHSIVNQIFLAFDDSMRAEKFTAEYKMAVLPSIHAKLITLLELMLKPKKDMTKVVNTLQTLYDIAIRDFPTSKKSIEQLKQEGLVPLRPSATGLLFENAVELPGENDATFYRQVRRLHTILTSRDSMNNVPKNIEARRRIAFFSNSLFMNMPRAPQVEKMLAFSVLTPYYNEEVLYDKTQLHSENEDGVSILFYLQKIYEDDWAYFLERMKREGMVSEKELWEERLRDLRLWASYRGQTLSRTVRGMMYYYKALKMLAFLDSASEIDIKDGSRELASIGSFRQEVDSYGLGDADRLPSSRNLSRASSGVSLLFKGHEYGTALMKYTYVVACQIYGNQKAKKDSRAEEILYLMKKNEALRVAYVDEVHTGTDEVAYYSVLVKYDQRLEREVEIYRVRLPGPLKLGEGKPENQNHALIFTRGDAVQTIDMNQDNYFEEALKMRNLLEEYNHYYGARKPTLLGVREHVFTGSVSSLAWFMSAQETSFVTLGQRVLANPLKVRMHYGHPDVFDRIWFLSRGGISKASRVINISEDIFAGFNCTLRGGNVTHHEYIQVGKGRDVGLNQISMFEAKVASGNGEQTLSRDVYRLGHRLDFFRMLSFFYTTVGFYFNTMMVVLTVYAFVWGRLYLALSGLEKTITDSADSTNNKALGVVLNQQFIIQLGLFTALPMIVENSLEHGFLPALWDFLTMQLQLASVFFTFSMGTKTHYYGRTILHGGAKYRATGRGFVVQHKSFAENYRLYARSHFIKAIELGVILTVYASYSAIASDTLVYIVMTISSWFLVVSWIMAPFAFNPSGFDWLKTVYDFDDFMSWIWYRGGIFAKPEQSWEVWWYEEQAHLRTTGLWGRLMEIVLDLRFFFFQYGIVYQLKIASGSHSIAVYLLSWICVFAAVGVFVVMAYARDRYAAKEHIYYRAVQAFIIILIVLVIIVLLKFTDFHIIDIFTSLLAFIPTGWGLISIAQVIRPFIESTVVWDTVVAVARLYDILFGVVVMAPVALLSWLPGFQEMQTRILFNEAFSRGLQISRIITGKKPNAI